MPQISFDAQGFAIGGRRIWLMGAAIESALLPTAQWSPMLAMLRERGFNTIRTSAPWQLHEMQRGRALFDDSLDLRAFVTLCRQHGLWVVLRIGPFVGGTYSGGGSPAWLAEIEALRPREPSEAFLQLVSRWYREVLGQVKGLEASLRNEPGRSADGAGGLLGVQIDHGWECGNTKVADKYLTELRRFVREGGVEVPVLTANGLWAGAEETIDVWQGAEDLFSHVRQLRHAQPHAPALVDVTPASARRLTAPWSSRKRAVPPARQETGRDCHDLLALVGRTIAAGGQAIVAHAAPEVHRVVPAGTELEGALGADAVTPLLVGHGGNPGAALGTVSPLALFASNFGTAIVGGGDGEAVVVDPDHPVTDAPVVVSRSASAGTIAFVFHCATDSSVMRGKKSTRPRRAPAPRAITLITAKGMRLPVSLGSASVAWFPIDLDLHGRARLDYAGLSPVAFVARSILVLFGPPSVRAVLSINGSERIVETPNSSADAKPCVLAHAGLTLVICSDAQAGSLIVEREAIVIGADRLEAEGMAVRAPGFRSVARIDANGRSTVVRSTPSVLASGAARRTRRATPAREDQRSLGRWMRADSTSLVAGTNARFASIDEPRSLAAFAPRTGLGWYRLRLAASRTETQLWFPGAAGVLLAALDGRPLAAIGRSDRLPLRIPASKGRDERTLVLLAVDVGRPIHGLASSVAPGVSGPAWQVAKLRARVKRIDTPMFDPFEKRAFVPLAPGPIPEYSVELKVTVERTKPIVIDPGCAFYGAVLVNGHMVDVVDLPDGSVAGITLGPGTPGWCGGVLKVTLVPMRDAPRLERSVTVHRLMNEIGPPRRGVTAWAFARWEVPGRTSGEWIEVGAKGARTRATPRATTGAPAWWSTRASASGHCDLVLTGLSTGLVLIDGAIAGRYDTVSDARLSLPFGALDAGAEVVIFDERGAEPSRVSLRSPPDARSS